MGKSTKAEKQSESPAQPEKKKRGQYKERECPYCHVHVRNLGNHIKMKHPAEAPTPPELTKDDLVGVGTAKPPEPKPEDANYFCMNCFEQTGKHYRVRKGETECWNCGQPLVWEEIE